MHASLGKRYGKKHCTKVHACLLHKWLSTRVEMSFVYISNGMHSIMAADASMWNQLIHSLLNSMKLSIYCGDAWLSLSFKLL